MLIGEKNKINLEKLVLVTDEKNNKKIIDEFYCYNIKFNSIIIVEEGKKLMLI